MKFAIIPLLLLLAACSPIRTPRLPAVPASTVGAPITREQAVAELETLAARLESVHPTLYADRTPASVAAERERIAAELPPTLSRIEWWKRVALMVANLGDSYTLAYLPGEELERRRARGELLFPIDTGWDPEHGLVVTNARGAGLASGDRVLAINGQDTADLVSDWMDYFGGNRDAQRAATVAALFRDLLAIEGIAAPYRLRVVGADGGAEHDVELEGITLAAFQGRSAGVPTPTAPNFTYRTLDASTGYMEFHSMSGPIDRFEQDLATMFSELAASGARTLIVDLRLNPGGDSRMGDELLRHITTKAYRGAARKEWKMSPEYKRYLKSFLRPPLRWLPVEYLSADGRRLLHADDGETVVLDSQPFARPPAEPFFDGAVCFLIGPRTGGSAMMLADAIKTFRLATLVGEETGSAPVSFGESYNFRLPESHLALQISSARFVRANGDANDLSGVLPDIPVRAETGRDAALERARSCPAVQ